MTDDRQERDDDDVEPSSDDFDDFFDSRAQWEAPSEGMEQPLDDHEDLPMSRRQRRRIRKTKKRHAIILIVGALVVVALIVVGLYSGYRALSRWSQSRAAQSTTSESLDYPGPGTGSVSFTVSTGESVDSVASRLVKAGVVKSAQSFTSVVSANSSTIYPGTYALKKRMPAADALAILSDQSKAKGMLEVKSGERVSDVVKSAASLSSIPEADFTAIVDAGGKGILPDEAEGHFEGWLEPGTYDVSNASSASAVLKQMVQARIAKLDDLGVPTGTERQKVLIMASIAESEVNTEEYYGKVVRVILNRLSKSMPLGMDTTVAYGAGVKASELTNAMLADTNNAYNTRVKTGLPPSPISNPGDSAITAAMNPPAGDWLYFVTTNLKTGETKFVATEDEFWKIREEYKNSNEDAN
ncbi:aminodeoxychorismate lyase [Bifidobacterium minimum]|uniref:Endolytic murein transglycosylase n=1 Tax=Bifidobacterium minimum TaxID=1693 RepID=A0A087BNW5_9BIFI|nr:endolytic transglycosylase MltG [Bifidobacterium minimum]KFI72715.1 aminodeoxychorismate lyase [Bifidobacterium minimum]